MISRKCFHCVLIHLSRIEPFSSFSLLTKSKVKVEVEVEIEIEMKQIYKL